MERFISIIIHISLNAIKHTYKGIISLKIKFYRGFLYAKISDNGIGMTINMMNQINRIAIIFITNNTSIINAALNSFEENKFLYGIGTLTAALIYVKN